MLRTMLFTGMVSLCMVTSVFSQTDDGNEAPIINLREGLVAFEQKPDCPGCRAFLAGYGTAESMHSPSCSCSCACDAGTAAGTGGGPGAPYAADSGEYQDLAASEFGAGLGYESAAPGMIGDFFGGSYQMNIVTAGQPVDFYTNIPQAGGDRRFKIAENYSPFPVDRIFFNYNHFHNALLTADGRNANLDRGTFGVEKTFLDQWWSIEFRLPVASGLNSDQTVSATANNVSNEIGNFAFALKRLLIQCDTYAVSAGLGLVAPTGPDGNLFDGNGRLVVTTFNEAIYLQPFLGLWWTPNDCLFGQFAVQADFDVRGNPVDVYAFGAGPDGTIQDQALMFFDASFGYWLFHDPYSDAVVTGVAPMIELHHNTTVEDPDILRMGADTITNPNTRMDVMNLTGALRLELAGTSYLTLFGVVPLRTDEEKLFDTEFGVQFTRFY
jgi:hypothetical protein